MSGSHGSSELTPEQADEMKEMYGVRITRVETGVHGVGMSRAERRHPPVRLAKVQPKRKKRRR